MFRTIPKRIRAYVTVENAHSCWRFQGVVSSKATEQTRGNFCLSRCRLVWTRRKASQDGSPLNGIGVAQLAGGAMFIFLVKKKRKEKENLPESGGGCGGGWASRKNPTSSCSVRQSVFFFPFFSGYPHVDCKRIWLPLRLLTHLAEGLHEQGPVASVFSSPISLSSYLPSNFVLSRFFFPRTFLGRSRVRDSSSRQPRSAVRRRRHGGRRFSATHSQIWNRT